MGLVDAAAARWRWRWASAMVAAWLLPPWLRLVGIVERWKKLATLGPFGPSVVAQSGAAL